MEEIDMIGNINDIFNLLQQLKQNPVGFSASKKFSIPQGINDPQQMVQYLLNTGQVKQNNVDQLFQQVFGHR
jgi:hypothetical protein